MSIPAEAFKAIRHKRTKNPRTILAFYATVMGLLLAACVGGATTILLTGRALYLLPWILGFGAVFSVLIVGGVFWISVRDPSKLMLGQVTGEEYAEIQKVVLGDSSSGERLTAIVLQESLTLEAEFLEVSDGHRLEEEEDG